MAEELGWPSPVSRDKPRGQMYAIRFDSFPGRSRITSRPSQTARMGSRYFNKEAFPLHRCRYWKVQSRRSREGVAYGSRRRWIAIEREGSQNSSRGSRHINHHSISAARYQVAVSVESRGKSHRNRAVFYCWHVALDDESVALGWSCWHGKLSDQCQNLEQNAEYFPAISRASRSNEKRL